MELVDFRHVAEQDVLLAEQGAGDEVSHGRVVHLCCVALEFNITYVTSTDSQNFQFPSHSPNERWDRSNPHVTVNRCMY